MGDIKFECPNCKRPMDGDEALVSEKVTCPDCSHEFTPLPQVEKILCPKCGQYQFPAQREREAVKCGDCGEWFKPDQASKEAGSGSDVEVRRAAIRKKAKNFSFAAAVLAIIGAIGVAMAICNTIAGNGDGAGTFVSGSLIGLALWLYLVAQIIHIRANTEK